MNHDMKCLQLAYDALFDLQGKTRPGDAPELAQAIQDVIEARRRNIEERPFKRAQERAKAGDNPQAVAIGYAAETLYRGR